MCIGNVWKSIGCQWDVYGCQCWMFKSDVSSMDANITMECLSAYIIVTSNVSLELES